VPRLLNKVVEFEIIFRCDINEFLIRLFWLIVICSIYVLKVVWHSVLRRILWLSVLFTYVGKTGCYNSKHEFSKVVDEVDLWMCWHGKGVRFSEWQSDGWVSFRAGSSSGWHISLMDTVLVPMLRFGWRIYSLWMIR